MQLMARCQRRSFFLRPSAEVTVFFGEEVTMDKIDGEEVRGAVREHYGKGAALDGPGCAPGCCGAGAQSSLKLGYSEADLASLPAGADLGLACGNPHVIAGLKAGETIVDLGSGAGFDCFLAARKVGPSGQVIGV